MQSYAYLSSIALFLVVLVAGNILDSRPGRGLRALSSSEVAAASAGVPVGRYKLSVFALSAAFAGLAGGITGTVFGAGGPPYAIYLSQRGLTKEQFRATLGLATLTSISLRLIAFLLTGLLLNREVWLTALTVVPSCLLGIWVARKIFSRISRDALMRAVALLLLASGAALIWRAMS